MITFRFGPEDLGRVRFAISPLFVLSASFDVLGDPTRHAAHAPWVRAAKPAVEGLDLELLEAVQPIGAPYRPDFVIPPPERPRPSLEEELDRIRHVPGAQVARELGWAYENRTMPPAAAALIQRPAEMLDRLADVMGAYFERAVAPVWDRLAAVLEADIAHRARRLTEAGPLGAFADLHPDVSWQRGALRVRRPYTATVELEGRGLLLLPAAFARNAWTMIDRPWQPTIAYPPRGAGLLWEPAETSGALAELLGRRRAAILDALAAPATTQELARALRASPAGVSEHLGVLRRSGLVAGHRDGRAVRYARTAAGEALLHAPDATL